MSRIRVSPRAPAVGTWALVGASAMALAVAASLPATAAAADAPPPMAASASTEIQEVVVNGIPYRETVLPTRLSSSSVYGLNLNVMDTPRNTTLLSTTQLQTLNIQDPRAFSYLTASSYTDSAFGAPNVPRIRGQFADIFINGMRSSFTASGAGSPLDFDSVENISITKGPGSVVDGAGPGVGGQADLQTKRPNLNHMTFYASASADSVHDNRLVVDAGGPIRKGVLGFRLSYSGEDSASFFPGHYNNKNALYGALTWQPNDRYKAEFNGEVIDQRYTENVGLNRANQALIDHHTYLQGQPVGDYQSTFFGFGPPGTIPVGSPGNPFSPVSPFLGEILLTNSVPIDTKKGIDQAGAMSLSRRYNAQLIQTYYVSDGLTLQNNTFFDYQDSADLENYYYADAAFGNWTLENKTTLNADLDLTVGGQVIKNQAIVGASLRFAHVKYIDNFDAETPNAYDLTQNPKLFYPSASNQLNFANAYVVRNPFGGLFLGNPGRDSVNGGNTGVSDVYDGGVFFQDRMAFTPRLSVLFGARVDAIKDHTHDPLGGPDCEACFTNLPEDHWTGTFGLFNGNVSVVYRPRPWVSGYATFDFTESNNPNGGEGGINAFGYDPVTNHGIADSKLLRQPSYLYEAGLKLNLLNNKLFIGTAVFNQKRVVPTGPGGVDSVNANIRGIEVEANYQPTRNLFATASYSFIDTTLSAPPGFNNYPAMAGDNYASLGLGMPVSMLDGAGNFAVFQPGHTYEDPGIPQHLFNFLANYKFDNGLGLRTGVLVTGPIDTTVSGPLVLSPTSNGAGAPVPGPGGKLIESSSLVPQPVIDAGGYYRSPQIPWQYTLNASVFYEFSHYVITASIYNLTDNVNWESSPSFYGNDFLVRSNPRTYELRLQVKF